ncbi:hypothetical protein A3Q35_13220 [Aeribacillus pallidus]|uniref:hypothetical protein n=1 Tax=Aeribacillus pallidus TaxID=33936 RepID=UPI0007B4985C|nr:hypothetical protein [Aeribacillus pallidus]KZM54914.1 hypothetical protein A3Q35_13220 [Aeribacillus pallidus]
MVNVHTDDEGLQWLYRELAELDRYSIEIGIFGSDDSFYAMIANVHEFGIQIKAKNKYLAIPTKEAGDRKPSEIPGLFQPKGKNVLAVADKTAENGIKVMFILKESVNIPERSFIRSTFDEKNDEWMDFLEKQIEKLCELEIDAKTVFKRLGARIVGDIQEKIRDIRTPKNSPLTIENKGFDNPLIDTGGLRMHVTWKLVRDDGEYV